jgi:hypothetical protein
MRRQAENENRRRLACSYAHRRVCSSRVRIDALGFVPYHTGMTNDETNNLFTQHDPLAIGELRPLKDLGAEGPLSYESLRKYARSGKLRARRLGYQWFSTRAAVDAYLASRHIENVPKKYRGG